mmetsp:Transcript_7722/g.10910  ORF Transcript_7722/g.10910 Transcript_7722/m.10910 type:complete len:87 (-) Transcript_7722:2041-2301(-)
MLIDSVAKVLKHLHFDILERVDLVADLLNLLLLIEGSLLLILLQLHRSQLLVEELGLLEAALLLSNHFRRLEVESLFLLSLGLAFS